MRRFHPFGTRPSGLPYETALTHAKLDIIIGHIIL